MNPPRERSYFWDFFGPRSAPTAAHFKHHLLGFFAQHGVEDVELLDVSRAPGHHAIGAKAPESHWELIEKALRPKRFEVSEPRDPTSRG